MKKFSRSIISLISAAMLLYTSSVAAPTVVNVSDYSADNSVCQETMTYSLNADSISPSECFGSGEGTKESPYIITTENELALLSKVINEKAEGFTDAFYSLGKDIDLGGKAITPIGQSQDTPFSADFDGNGFTISNFTLEEGQYVGLFGYIYNGNVRMLGINNLKISASPASTVANAAYVGSLAGYIESTTGSGTISKVSISDVSMDVDASIEKLYVGGLIGYGSSELSGFITISDCFVQTDISAINSYTKGYTYAGGIAGQFDTGSASLSLIRNTVSKGSVISESYQSSRAGGFVGYLFSSGSAYGTAQLLASDEDIMIENCIAVTDVSSHSRRYTSAAGNIVGAYNTHAAMKNALYPNDGNVSITAVKSSSTMKAEICTDGSRVSSSKLKTASYLAENHGFDFENTWEISEDKNDGYPHLTCIRSDKVYIPVFAHSMQAYLNLESEVSMGVGYRFEDMQSIDPYDFEERLGLLLWDAESTPEESEATYENCKNIIEGAKYEAEQGRFESTTHGIAAKNLGDSLSFRAYFVNDNGSYTYSRLISNYSPKQYCYNQISKYPDDEINKALMASILNYGAEAQKYFGYNTENLMNSGLSEELKVVAWDASLVRNDYSVQDGKDSGFAKDSSITSRGGYLNLNGAIDYNYYAQIDFEPTSATIFYWTESDITKLDSLTLSNASSSESLTYISERSRYEGKYEGQPAKKMYETIFALMVFEKADGEMVTSGVIGYSPERYAFINHAKNNRESALSMALAVYGDAARTYFKNK